MSVWSDITTNFDTLMTVTLAGVTNNTFTKSNDAIELDVNPSSIFNGLYSVQMQEIREVYGDVNVYLDENYVVRLQVAFELNTNDGRTDYDSAIEDIQTIINHRLNNLSWGTLTSIGNVQLQLAGSPRFLYKTNETFLTVALDFVVTVRDTLR